LSLKWSYILCVTRRQSENYVLGQLKVSLIMKIQFQPHLFAAFMSRGCLIPVFELFLGANCRVLSIDHKIKYLVKQMLTLIMYF
jgi:hypothetical protein